MSRHDPFQKVTDKLLLDLVCEMKKSNEQAHIHTRLLELILHAVVRPPTKLNIVSGDDMPLPFAPGQTIKYQLQLGPAGFTAPTSATYSFTSDDALVVITPDTSDATGATFDAAIDPSDTVGKVVTFSGAVSGTNADGSPLSLTASTIQETVVAVTPPEVNPTELNIVRLT